MLLLLFFFFVCRALEGWESFAWGFDVDDDDKGADLGVSVDEGVGVDVDTGVLSEEEGLTLDGDDLEDLTGEGFFVKKENKFPCFISRNDFEIAIQYSLLYVSN